MKYNLLYNISTFSFISFIKSIADGYHLTRPQESGDGALRSMKEALIDADIKVE